jgi:hypothetical protein
MTKYFTELNTFAKLLKAKFPNAVTYPVSYSGGVPGWEATLNEENYPEIVEWLADKFGQPVHKPGWHPWHRRGEPVLVFKKMRAMKINKMHHVNVIRMHNRKTHRYTLLAWS